MEVIATIHTSFTVADLDATVAFFTDALGCSVRWPAQPLTAFMEEVTGVDGADVRVAVVICPGHAIELFQYQGPADRSAARLRPCDVGFSHLAFQVDDLDSAVARAAPHGFLPARGYARFETEQVSGRATYLRGPDGLAIELIEMSPRPQETAS